MNATTEMSGMIQTGMRWIAALMIAMLTLGVNGCGQSREYPKNIREFPEPWKTLEPGQRRETFPVPRVITQGGGGAIDRGDLVQLHVRSKRRSDGTPHDWGDWWIWIGFRSPEESSLFSNEPSVASAMVGLQEGTQLEFLTTEGGRSTAGELTPNVLGDNAYYSWRKNTRDFTNIYISTDSDSSLVEIKRVCKGQAQYRTVRLFDDSPVKVCRGLDCYVSNEPREAWIDEAKIEATCQDGRKVKFEYGPVDSRNGKDEKSQVHGYFDEWFKNAWRKIPRGVQFEGNQPPVAKADKFTIPGPTATRVDMLANDTDPDHDRLTARVIRPPRNGTLSANADGTYTYTPTNECRGDNFTYRASDGLVESDDVSVNISITRDKPADPNLLSKC